MEYEEVLMQLISGSGAAHACAIEAIRKARAGDFDAADSLIEEGREALGNAQNLHFKLLRDDARGNTVEFSMLLTHAQDHLMNSNTVMELAREIIGLCRQVLPDKK